MIKLIGIFIIVFLTVTKSWSSLVINPTLKTYRVTNSDGSKVYLKGNKNTYSIDRNKFALKKIKINQKVKIYEPSFLLVAKKIK